MFWEREPKEVSFQLTWTLLHISAAVLHIGGVIYHFKRLLKSLAEHNHG